MTRSGRIGLALVALVALTVRLYGLSWGLADFYEEAYPYRVAWVASAPDAIEREALTSLRAGLGQGAPALAADSLTDLRKVVAR